MKSFETELKQILSIDKKYLPISKKLGVVLRDLQPFLSKINAIESKHKESFVLESVNVHKTYAENLENYQKSLKLIIEKNNQEVEKSQKLKVQLTHELNHHLKMQLDELDQKITVILQDSQEKLGKADQTLKRELAAIHKTMTESRKTYQNVSMEIEKEKELAVTQLRAAYDQKIEALKIELERNQAIYQEKLSSIKAQALVNTEEHNDSYLTIKNTYTQLSISLNKKINELKKKQQTLLANLEKDHQKAIKPVIESIDKLKENYQLALQKSLQDYTEKLTSLNVIFDVQKTSYESKKERIIHEGNEAITLLNSKLSAYKETISKEKLTTSRALRDEMKSLETDREKEKKNHDLTNQLNALDADLNKQILRTNKDITEKKKETHRRLFQLDLAHLREVNEWRLKKVLYEYEKKQDTAKIDLNYNHNINASELQLKLIEFKNQAEKEILLQKHNQDLLPLEYQLQIAASIQERELNLLANDAHLSIATSKFEESQIEYELKKQEALSQFEEDKAKALFGADMQVLSTNIQLELEKEKVKRDYVIAEQELRIELNQAIFNRSKLLIEHEQNQEIYKIESERELIYIENRYKLDAIKSNALAEEQKRTFVVSEARYKHQQRLSNEKANRLLKTYLNELSFNQLQTEDFMTVCRKFYQSLTDLKKTAIELYHLPSHPEVFKDVLKMMKSYLPQFQASMIEELEHYQALNQEIYVNKIEDLTGYKYMLKHENTMNYYGQEIAKIKEKKASVERDIQSLEEQFFKYQTELERNHAFINQLTKISYEIKHNELRSEHKHQDLKENQKLLSNHEHEVKRIKQSLSKIEKDIDEKHLLIAPLDKEIALLSQKQDLQEKELEVKKHKEAAVFYRFLNKNQKIYQELSMDMAHFLEKLSFFFEALSQEVYLTDTVLNVEIKKFERHASLFELKLNRHQQAFLNLMLEFYHKNEKEQAMLMKDFKRSTIALMKSLSQNYNNTLSKALHDQTKKNHEEQRQNQNEKDKVKKKLELEMISYQKKLSIDLSVIKSLESKIAETGDKALLELKILNENQISIANQYQNEHLHKVSMMLDQYKKTLSQIELNKHQAEKNQQGLENSLEAKNQVILTKYQTNYQKHLSNLKSKTLHYEEEMGKLKKSIAEREKAHEETLKRMNEKREEELRNILYHLKKFTSSTKSEQNQVMSKEVRLLKKTNRSKIKMLHLS